MSSKKVVIVTGSNCGIGFEVTRMLCRDGYDVIMACRSEQKAGAALEQLKEDNPNVSASFMQLDLSSLESIKSFATSFKKSGRRLDVLINNAGVFLHAPERFTTKDGAELTMGTNYIGHFLLTQLLFPELQKTAETAGESRIVVVSSTLHDTKIASMGGRRQVTFIDPDDLQLEKPEAYTGYQAYKNSKAANVMFSHSLARQLKDSRVTVNCLCPGFIPGTELSRQSGGFTRFINRWVLDWMLKPFVKITKTPEEGGAAVLKLATDPQLKGVRGKYYVNNQDIESSEESRDPALQRKLWDLAVQRTQANMPFPTD